jgi:hypothetical protein
MGNSVETLLANVSAAAEVSYPMSGVAAYFGKK